MNVLVAQPMIATGDVPCERDGPRTCLSDLLHRPSLDSGAVTGSARGGRCVSVGAARLRGGLGAALGRAGLLLQCSSHRAPLLCDRAVLVALGFAQIVFMTTCNPPGANRGANYYLRGRG